jgi:hypothetical protein
MKARYTDETMFTKRDLRPTPADYRREVVEALLDVLVAHDLMSPADRTNVMATMNRDLSKLQAAASVVSLFQAYVQPNLLDRDKTRALQGAIETLKQAQGDTTITTVEIPMQPATLNPATLNPATLNPTPINPDL